jgi:alkylation response protein AidB-like acyl-CoA dehydrogenase
VLSRDGAHLAIESMDPRSAGNRDHERDVARPEAAHRVQRGAGSRVTGRPVFLDEHSTRDQQRELASLVTQASRAAGDVSAALVLAADVGVALPVPGAGTTSHLWSALATLGAADLTVARVLEPHLDALAILAQASVSETPGSWGVFAAEGPGRPLRADATGSSYTITGRKHWCSLAGSLDRALVSAWTGPEERRLFAVDLHDPGVAALPGTWVARGLSAVDSGPVDFDAVPATPVGEAGWYLERPGFAWGGLGVAAIWYGGAVGVARRLLEGATRRAPDQLALVHLGAVDGVLHAARCALSDAAMAIDAGVLLGADGARAALRVRQVVASAAEEVLQRAGHGLGPGPLATEEEHARRVADLELYLRQWHAERDLASLGELLLEDGPRSW